MIDQLLSMFFTKKMLYSALRQVLSGVTGMLAAKGVISGTSTDEVVLALATGLCSLIWSAWEKHLEKQALDHHTTYLLNRIESALQGPATK